MDKINISNLFPGEQDDQGQDYRPVDVHSLFNLNKSKNKKTAFNLDRLVKLREERKMKVLLQYEKVFNLCLNKINLANNLNKLELAYDIPEAMYGSFEYNSIDCLLYITEKIKKMEIDVIILSESSLYISWVNLGTNLNKK